MKETVIQKLHSTICQFLFLRFFSNFFVSGLGFQLEYKTSIVTRWSYSSGSCGGSYTTQNGILTSPLYPGNYATDAICNYTISQPMGTVILLNFLSMYIHQEHQAGDGKCHDTLVIRDGPSYDSPLLYKLCDNEVPAPIKSSQNQVWIR